jgi:hypothetical protein
MIALALIASFTAGNVVGLTAATVASFAVVWVSIRLEKPSK